MVGGNADMCGAARDHAENGSQYAFDRAHFVAVWIAGRWNRVVVPEQLVSTVDEIDFQWL